MDKGSFRFGGQRGDMSPERGRATGREAAYAVAPAPAPAMRRVMKVLMKVQVVYYLTRNGQLEHPHFMEVSHLANQQLRLKDFIDRLVVLRGRGMPSRYSWSCKRSYKNGYVWNDLTENDIIHTSEGAEYILKGSEILHSSSGSFMAEEAERIQQLQISEKRAPPTVYNNPISKLKPNSSPINGDLKLLKSPTKVEEEYYPEEIDEECDAPSCNCSRRAVSNEEARFANGSARFLNGSIGSTRFANRKSLSEALNNNNNSNNSNNNISNDNNNNNPDDDNRSPQSTTSTLSSEKEEKVKSKSREASRRFMVVQEEEQEPSRSSVLLQLIACGGSVAAKGKSIPCLKQQMSGRMEGRVGGGNGGGLQRAVVCKAAGKVVVVGEEEEMIKYMSENPRFGNLQAEEREFFSGSILEAMDDQRRGQQLEPVLKKSSSYKEERSSKTGLIETAAETGEEASKVEKAASACGKSKCIPNPMRKHQKQSNKK